MAKMEVGLVCDFKSKVAWRSYSGDSYGGTQVVIGWEVTLMVVGDMVLAW